MGIWFRDYTLEELQRLNQNTAAQHLQIQFTHIGEDFLEATMPVNSTTRQPYGILHGGASALLAETIGSVASSMAIDHNQYYTVGISLGIDHLRQVQDGKVTGIATPVHLGRTLHLWQVEINDDKERLIARSKLNCMILKR